MRIDIVGGAYKQPFWHINTQKCINWYVKKTSSNEKNKQSQILYPTPGSVEYVDTAKTSVSRLFVRGNKMYCVAGDEFFDISDGSATSLGTLTNASNYRPYILANANNEIGIFIDNLAWVYDEDTSTLSAVTDADFIEAKTATFTDGYAVITANDRVEYSELNNLNDWRAENVFTPAFKADATKAVIAFKEQLVCFGDETIEHYINDGTPFTRLTRTSTSLGIQAPHSLAVSNDGIAFIGKSHRGGASVYFLSNDFIPKKISVPSIDYQLNKEDGVEAAIGFIEETNDGHIFYHITLVDSDQTFSYDFLTNEWHQRSSKRPWNDVDGQVNYGRWRANDLVYFNGNRYIADCYSGKVLKLDDTTYTEDSQTILRRRVTKIYDQDFRNIPVSELEIDLNMGMGLLANQGSNPRLMFKSSIDGGQTWSYEKFLDIGPRGDYTKRAKVNGLGTARDWVVDISISDPVPVAVLGASFKGLQANR